MFTIIGTMFTGIILGYIFRNMDFLKKTEKTISYTIILLLFIMGLSVGSNDRKHHRGMAGTDTVFQERRKP